MKKKILFFLFLGVLFLGKAQEFQGKIIISENSVLYLNQIYVTNLNTRNTVLADYQGHFSLPAKVGDKIRFSSIVTERRDITVTQEMLERQLTMISLEVAYYQIKEVVVGNFKPTGNLEADIRKLPKSQSLVLAEKIGLPIPKDPDYPSLSSVLDFNNGGLGFNLHSIFDIVSGAKRREERLRTYERMKEGVTAMRKYFGDEFFITKGIPRNLIENFLQFVYTSDNLGPILAVQNFVQAELSIEKFLPVYLKRLKISRLGEILEDENTTNKTLEVGKE